MSQELRSWPVLAKIALKWSTSGLLGRGKKCLKFGDSYPQNYGQGYCTSSNIIVMCLTGVMIDFQRTNAGWSESYFRENKKKTLSLLYCLGQTNGYMHILAMRNNQLFVWVYYHWIDDNNRLLTFAMVQAITPFEGMFGFSSHKLLFPKIKR